MLAELQGLLATAADAATHIDLAAADDAAAIIGRLTAGLHAFSQVRGAAQLQASQPHASH
eukprot:SAG22_NODE_106_length_19904_cov_14.387175_12_plen_60_part_00